MNTQLRKDFQRFLASSGYCTPPGKAACALRSARILAEWREAESAGLVRLGMTAEQENYFDVYGKPEDEKELAQLTACLERMGCYGVFSEVNTGSEASGDKWEWADSIGMCVYDRPLDPFDNDYVIDLMAAALAKIPQPGNVDELCTALD